MSCIFMNPVTILFRRILYKIPLKRLLVLLAVFAVGFAYTNAFDLTFNSSGSNTLNNSTITKWDIWQIVCGATNNTNWFYLWWNKFNQYVPGCLKWPTTISGSANVRWVIYDITCPSCPSCPSQYTSQECQTEYSLISISSVDQEYCENNNLCPLYDCPVNSWWSLSNVYINNILHVGAPNIFMNIPEEIDRDYAYTTWWQNMNIDIVWYNQDTEYINNLIDVQTYQPTSEDFTNVFLGFKEYAWLLVVTLFIILSFYLVKKSFK